jgi:hypothetical protein
METPERPSGLLLHNPAWLIDHLDFGKQIQAEKGVGFRNVSNTIELG